MVVKKIQINLFSQVFKTKVTTSLKSIKLCKFDCMMLMIILTASTDQSCDINILPEP